MISLDGSIILNFLIEMIKVALVAIAVLIFVMVFVLYVILKLRWVIARIQSRLGPNRVGPWGVFQTVADALKLLQKEDIIPKGADRWLFILAPSLVFIPAYLVFAVIPYGKNMTPANLNVGVVYLSAISSLSVIGIVVGGWASNNKWSLLGAFRGASQLIAYELPIALAVCIPVMISGSLSFNDIVTQQAGSIFSWNLFRFTAYPMVPIAFLTLLTAGLAEINVTPFDIMEAESELVSGFNTEYSGMKFALFFLAEFAESFTLSAVLVTLFLGGYHPPIYALGGQLAGFWGSLVSAGWFLLKTWLVVLLILWIRSTFPRVRMDQLMNLSWKALLPVGIVNLVLCGAYIAFWMPK